MSRNIRGNTGRFAVGNSGRPRGARNRLTRNAKEAFQLAFDALGGDVALAKLAKENQTDFYKLFARLIPAEHNGAVDLNHHDDDARAIREELLRDPTADREGATPGTLQ